MVMSRDQNTGRNLNIKIDMCSFKNGRFQILGITLKYQISIQEDIKSRLKSGNACYHSVQNLLSTCLPRISSCNF